MTEKSIEERAREAIEQVRDIVVEATEKDMLAVLDAVDPSTDATLDLELMLYELNRRQALLAETLDSCWKIVVNMAEVFSEHVAEKEGSDG